MIVVQTFNRAGWPPDSTIELENGPAAALLTAVRDYEAEKHISLHGDYLAAPVGGDRTMAEVVEMRAAFRAPRTSALWLTIGRDKYNMDPRSTAIPSLTSPHLDGYCLDISDNGFLAWLKSPDPRRPGHNIAARYGLVFTLLRENDLRHCQFFPGTATAALDVTSLNNDTPIHPEDADMPKLIGRNDGTAAAPAWTYALFDGEHWEETSDPHVAGVWAQLYNDGNSARDITGNAGAIAAWNYRSNDRPDLKKPFGVTASAGGATADQVATAVDAILKDDFAALAAQEGTDQAAVLAAIGQVDENTLATFGLKRV